MWDRSSKPSRPNTAEASGSVVPKLMASAS